jgi:glycosyltransferase involved in cell wall biosynthesis
MNRYDLSVLIPARNEMFLAKTVETILKNIRGRTEVIVVLDGQWANPAIIDDPRLTIIYNPVALGQRAATNQAARLSQAKYVMKIDAHCAVDEGFDTKMMEEMQDHLTMIPAMYNHHAFDWKCIGQNPKSGKLYIDPEVEKDIYAGCGHTIYQGPTPEKCPNCQGNMERLLIWEPRWKRKSYYYRFDKTMHFQYWSDYGKRDIAKGDIVPIITIQGSCFMLTREKYWELDICEEKFGSWGQQGVEVALKTWFSGGEVVVNKKTWYSHMFRTQGGDFGFPYPLSGSDVEKARKYSRWLLQEGNWNKALPGHDLNWLLKKFSPVPEWHDVNLTELEKVEKERDSVQFSMKPGKEEWQKYLEKKPSKGVVYYTDGQLDEKLAYRCREQLLKGMKGKHIVGVTLNPGRFEGLELAGFKHTIVMSESRGYFTMAKQILMGLEAQTADVIFFAEHDVLYHPSHFNFIPPRKDKYYYNTNVWRVRREDGHALYTDNLQQLSGLVAWRETLLEHYRKRVALLAEFCDKWHTEGEVNEYVRKMGFEPGTHGRPERVDDLKAESYQSKYPNLDIRHEQNLTPSRWSKEQFRNEKYTHGWSEAHVSTLPGWDGLVLP